MQSSSSLNSNSEQKNSLITAAAIDEFFKSILAKDEIYLENDFNKYIILGIITELAQLEITKKIHLSANFTPEKINIIVKNGKPFTFVPHHDMPEDNVVYLAEKMLPHSCIQFGNKTPLTTIKKAAAKLNGKMLYLDGSHTLEEACEIVKTLAPGSTLMLNPAVPDVDFLYGVAIIAFLPYHVLLQTSNWIPAQAGGLNQLMSMKLAKGLAINAALLAAQENPSISNESSSLSSSPNKRKRTGESEENPNTNKEHKGEGNRLIQSESVETLFSTPPSSSLQTQTSPISSIGLFSNTEQEFNSTPITPPFESRVLSLSWNGELSE